MSVLSYSRRHCLKGPYGMPALASVVLVLSMVLMSVGRLRSRADLPSIHLPVGHSDSICRLWEVPIVQVTLDNSRRVHLQVNDSLLQARLIQQISLPISTYQIANSVQLATQLSQVFYQKPMAIWLRADQQISSGEIMTIFHELRRQGISRIFVVMETEQASS